MSKHYYLAGEGSLWAQPNGANTEPVYLGCHVLGDITRDRGGVEPIWCQDESGPNRFKVVGTVQGAPGLVTTDITAKMTDDLDELEKADCAFPLFVIMSKAGRKDMITNSDRVFVLSNARITSEGITGLVVSNPDDNAASELTFDVTAEALLRLAAPDIDRQSISETSNISDISFPAERRCRTDETAAQRADAIGFASTTAPTGSPSTTANVLLTTNGGTWTAAAADPFAATEDIIAIESFYIGRNTIRIVVARGTADAGNPAEIAYSDDSGATWSNVDVGAVNGQYAPTRHSLFALDYRNMWLATHLGYVYFSADGGATWATQQASTITAAAINCIRFADRDVGWFCGANGVIARTVDGGESWSAVTGPSAQSAVAANVVDVLDRNRAWVGYADGELWYTEDAGVTWTQNARFSGSGVGQIRDIRFFDDNLAYMIRNTASPVGKVLWTYDGGYDWVELTSATNAGYNTLSLIDEWTFYVGGQAYSATGWISKGVA